MVLVVVLVVVGLEWRREREPQVDARLMAVDFLAPVALTKSVLGGMLKRRAGKVIVVSSVQGRLAIPFRTS